MAKYHISPTTGRPNLCRAQEGNCPLAGAGEHFPSKEAAREGYENKMSSSTVAPAAKKPTKKPLGDRSYPLSIQELKGLEKHLPELYRNEWSPAWRALNNALIDQDQFTTPEELASLRSVAAVKGWDEELYAQRATRPKIETMGRLSDNGGKDLTANLRKHLETYGLTRRESGYSGAENTGVTTAMGSTGYSVAVVQDPHGLKGDTRLSWNVPLSGKDVGVRYREETEWNPDTGEEYLHVPVNQDEVHPRIRKAFQELGLEVKEVRSSGYQTKWDDDVAYTVITGYPEVLGKPREQRRPTRGGWGYGNGSY